MLTFYYWFFYLYTWADPEIFVRGVKVHLTEESSDIFFLNIFFSPQLIYKGFNGVFQG